MEKRSLLKAQEDLRIAAAEFRDALIKAWRIEDLVQWLSRRLDNDS